MFRVAVAKDLTLSDGSRLKIDLLYRPVAPPDRLRVTDLLGAEWERTDADWIASLRGIYADSLSSVTAVARCGDYDVGTATTSFSVDHPEIAVIENVTTVTKYRRRGIAAALTETLVHLAFDAGCRLCFLGNANRLGRQSVYERIGFSRLRSSSILRRAAQGFEDYEKDLYGTGQQTSVRLARWGDLPGVAALVAQPLDTFMADYQRGIGSITFVEPTRCVSAFTSIWYDTQARGGIMRVLTGDTTSRVLGFGTVAPGPAPLRHSVVVIDLVTHDTYSEDSVMLLASLTDDGHRLGAQRAVAYLAVRDRVKRELFLSNGYRVIGSLPQELTMGSNQIDVDILEYSYG